MSGWRVWLGFEVRPGVTSTSMRDNSDHWRGLAEECRGADGRIDPVEFNRWMTCLVEHAHLWGYA